MNIILEDKRAKLLSDQKQGRNYVWYNQSKGKNRYQRRLKSKIKASVSHMNNIDMNKFFKDDILDVSIDVQGETSNYVVRLSFYGTLDELHNFLNVDDTFDRKAILKALTRAFNRDDVYMNCTCADFHYRHRYWATKNNLVVGKKEDRPNRFDWTNKNNDMGPACKHITLALTDSSWLIKVASVIYNYINYMQDHEERMYQKYIYPAIYQKPWTEEETQLDITDIDDTDELETDSDIIDKSNIEARKRGQFKPGNEYRFQKELNDDGEQQSFDLDSLENEE